MDAYTKTLDADGRTTVTATLTLPAGTQALVVDQDNGGWNIHDMSFAPSGVTSSWFEVVNQSSGLCATAAGGMGTVPPSRGPDARPA